MLEAQKTTTRLMSLWGETWPTDATVERREYEAMRFGFWYRGRWYPYMAGGNGEDDKDDGQSDDAGKDGDQGDGAKGQDGDAGDHGDDAEKRRRNSEQARMRTMQKKLEEYERKEHEREVAAAKEKGEFERLYTETKTDLEGKLAEQQAAMFRRDAKDALLTYLGDKHPSHMARLKWIWPVLAADLKPDLDEDGVAALVKRVADDYVKDHPIQTDASGAPDGANGGKGSKGKDDPLAKFAGIKEFADQRLTPINAGAGGH